MTTIINPAVEIKPVTYQNDEAVLIDLLDNPLDPSQKPIRAIFGDFWSPYRLLHPELTDQQIKAGNLISTCQTSVLGVNVSICPECKKVTYHPVSCNNRYCPNCQAANQRKWAEAKKAEIIPDVPYYHFVQTIPHSLNPVIQANQKVVIGAFLSSVGEAIKELAMDPKYLGAVPAITIVLHTWDQHLLPHIHAHCLISGAGLDPEKKLVTIQEVNALKGKKPSEATAIPFFIPERVLSARIRTVFLDKLDELYSDGLLEFSDELSELRSYENWHYLIQKLHRNNWVGHIEGCACGETHVIDYMARYIYRTAISNARVSYDPEKKVVTVSYIKRSKKKNEKGVKDTFELTPYQFIHRFMQHILPKGFCRVRSYGMTANSCKNKNLEIAFSSKGFTYARSAFCDMRTSELMEHLFEGFGVCPDCGAKMIRVGRFAANRKPFKCIIRKKSVAAA